MTGILRFETKHGEVLVEVDEAVARAAGGETEAPGMTAKGTQPLTARGAGDVIANAPRSFEEAMGSLRAYAASLQDLIATLDVAPREVTVEIGLKMAGSAGFIIAKAEAETEMKVALKWEPRPRTETPS